MATGLKAAILPDSQRRTLEELTDDLDLSSGDAASKRSAFWVMLVLSALIASAGVLSDSTATVIGAMIIAPLSTPIMGIALGIAKTMPRAAVRSGMFVLGGSVIVVAIGALFALAVPDTFDLLGDSQISGRTSPGLLDLIAAIATGFAGAIALARRDVAAVLPGVAIAISLVPPLAVVGVCAGQRAFALALGALVLFMSNLLAMVLAGSLVFAVLGYGSDNAASTPAGSRRKAYLSIGVLLVAVGVPLLANTVGTYLVSAWTASSQAAAEDWLKAVPGSSVDNVEFKSSTLYLSVQTPGDLPPVDSLLASLDGAVPKGIPVVVTTTIGQRIEAGTVGD